MSNLVLNDAGHDNAPDLDRLAIVGHDVGKVGIGRDQAEEIRTGVQGLACEVAIDNGDDDVTTLGLDRPVHQHDRAIQDARIAHGVPTYAQHERGLRVLDQLVHQVDALELVIFGRAGETGLHAGRK